MKILFYISIGLILLCIVSLVYAHKLFTATGWKDTDYVLIKIKNKTIRAEVAASAEKKSAGLSNRQSLDEDSGMLFIFSEPHRYPFWMHNMRMPLDFIWIRNGIIVDSTQNVQPPTSGEFPRTVLSSEPIDMTLEVPAGIINQYNIQIGDTVEIKKNK